MVGDTGWRRNGWVALFILPSLAGMLLFIIGPILASAVLTLFEWDLLTDPKFVGLANFRRLFHDNDIWKALLHT
jgi:multiple sugar transport system permease protein